MSIENLPPEMQARIASIIEQAGMPQEALPATVKVPTAPPPVKVPSLMDHTIALRQEVAALRQELNAIGQVTEAVGQAVGSLYSMFQSQTEPSNFSTNFQAAQQPQVDEDY